MIPKVIFKKLIGHLAKVRQDEEEHMKTAKGLASVPLEVGQSVTLFLNSNRIHERQHKEVLDYLLKSGVLATHPWGGYMFPLPKGASVPPVESAPKLIQESIRKMNERINE